MSKANLRSPGSVIDVDQFLNDTKLGKEARKLIKEREVAIEELLEFDQNDLNRFAEDLKLDSLSRNRFIKAITSLQPKQVPSSSYTPPLSTHFSAKQHVIVSPAEHNAIVKLYEKYDKASSLSNSIQSAVHALLESETFIHLEIESNINALIEEVLKRKDASLSDIDTMIKYKKEILSQQLNVIENYIKMVHEGKRKYEAYISQRNIDISERKKEILAMTKDILQCDGVSMSFLTAPDIRFNNEKHSQQLHKLYDKMEINDCDEPKPMQISVYKVYDAMIEVQYALHNDDIIGPHAVLQIVLEYAVLDKIYSKRNEAKAKKKKKGYDSNDSDSDDSSSDSDDSISGSSSDGVHNIDEEIDDIDINSLKWIENDGKIKYKKHKKRNKYKLQNLKENRAYLVRIRARNASGFGPYSKIVSVVTPKSEIKFDRFDKRYIAIEKKGKMVRTCSNSCTYVSVFSSKGFSSGIKKWKIKIVSRKHGSTEQVGIVTTIYNDTQCYSKQITTCGGVSSGTGLVNGDIIEIILDFKKGNVRFLKNKNHLKEQNISKGVKYYPAITTCACANQVFQVLTK